MEKPLILWGGTDINPNLYGQVPHPRTQYPDEQRDHDEVKLIKAAFERKQPIIGICRGAQLVSVLNGASLYQHSIGHNCSHTVHCHQKDEMVAIHNVAADHHQIIKLDDVDINDYVIYAFANFSCVVWEDKDNKKEITFVPEVVWFPKTRCLAVQPHPEWMDKKHPFNLWLNQLISNLIGEHDVL